MDSVDDDSNIDMSNLSKEERKRIKEQQIIERSLAERAKRNKKDASFQDRFQAALAKHKGKKIPTKTAMLHPNNNYDTEMSNYESTKEAANSNDRRHGAPEDNTKAVQDHELLRERLQNDDVKSSRSEVALKSKKFNKSKSRNRREEEARKVAEDVEFQERFEQILAKHDGKAKHENQDTDMVDYNRAASNAESNYGGKRRREADDDGILASMQHMQVRTGRKR
jgi:hypothetical protein